MQAGWTINIVGHDVKPAHWFLANENNIRIHPRAQTAATEGSLNELGWVKSVTVNLRAAEIWGDDRHIQTLLDGHDRIKLALSRGDDTPVPIEYVDLSPDKEYTFLLVVDEIGAMAGKDREKLALLLHDTKPADATLQQFLSDLAAKEGLYTGNGGGTVEDAPEPQIDRAGALQEQWGTAIGQLWEIPSLTVPGKSHRLLCGDSTKDLQELMGETRANLLLCSPPYANQRRYGLGDFDWDTVIPGALILSTRLMGTPSSLLVNLGLIHRDGEVIEYWQTLFESLRTVGWPLFAWYVWDKMEGIPGDWGGRLRQVHEWVFHFAKIRPFTQKTKVSKHVGKLRSGGLRQANDQMSDHLKSEKWSVPFYKMADSIIRAAPAKGGIEGHPAPYSVQFATESMTPFTREGMIILDPFLGSGTTMVAAEQLGRLCYGCDIEPKYIAVTLQRLADMGLTPKLVAS